MTSPLYEMYVYVDPDTRAVASIQMNSSLGLSVRQDGEWVPVEDGDVALDYQNNGFIVYEFDSEKDDSELSDNPTDAEADAWKPALIALFDEGDAKEEDAKKYGHLVSDADGEFPSTGE
jgi:hypothetical protein